MILEDDWGDWEIQKSVPAGMGECCKKCHRILELKNNLRGCFSVGNSEG